MSVKIQNWSFVSRNATPYTAPECIRLQLSGEVYGHPYKTDGKSVYTSDIQDIDLKNKRVQTKNTTYELEGDPDPKWVLWLKANNLYNRYF